MSQSPIQQSEPSTGPDHLRKRGTGFWVLVVGGCLGLCGVVLVVVIILVGVLAGLTEDAGAPGAARNEAAPTGPAASANQPDDFIYNSPNGLVYVAPHHVSREGVSVTLAGEWREDHRHVILRLHEGGRYDLSAGGGALRGASISDLVASNSAEQGAWTLEESTLTLTPDQYDLSGIAERKGSSTSGKADGPRKWSVVGVTIDYTPHGGDTVRQRPGLHINGPSPSWYYPPGNWDWVLRSAR